MNIPAKSFLGVAVAFGLAIAGYAGAGTNEVRTVTDLAGRAVRAPVGINRLVALGPGALRLVAYLQALDMVVGIEDMEKRMERSVMIRPYAAALPKDFFRLPVVGPGGPGKLPDFERLLLSRPDIVVAVATDPAETRNIETKTGIPTVYLSYGDMGTWGAEVRRSLFLLGLLLDRTNRAHQVNAYIQSLEDDLQRRTKTIPADRRPSAYFGGISYKGAQGITSTQAGYAPAVMVHARNVADALGKRGHLLIDKEQIITWDPDVLFVDIGSRAILEQDFEKGRSFYRLLKATGSGRVYSLLPHNYYNTNIEIALLNAYFIGKCLYPDAFADVEMERKAREIFVELLGLRVTEPLAAYEAVRFHETGPIRWSPGSRTSR